MILAAGNGVCVEVGVPDFPVLGRQPSVVWNTRANAGLVALPVTPLMTSRQPLFPPGLGSHVGEQRWPQLWLPSPKHLAQARPPLFPGKAPFLQFSYLPAFPQAPSASLLGKLTPLVKVEEPSQRAEGWFWGFSPQSSQ